MALKSDDLDAVLGCYHCHTNLDVYTNRARYDEVFEPAKKMTHAIWRKHGFI